MKSWESQLARYVELCDQEAEARAELENYDNVKATVLALAMKASGESSAAAQRREADASEEYREWCAERFAAAKVYHGAHLRRLAAEVWFRMLQTTESSRRAEMNLAR